MISARRVTTKLILIFALCLFASPRAQATTFGDAAITVAVGTVAGAVLGASTLPFYEDSGKHTKNIFYGAAIGAVVGVVASAYSGVTGHPGDEEALLRLKSPTRLGVNESPEMRLHAEASTATRRLSALGDQATLVWSPLAQVNF